jgi:putative ABC transport system permease protein
MGIPVVMGRELGPQDTNGIHAAVINQTFEKRFFGGVNPIGKHVRDTYPGNPADLEVVGVVADAKYNSLRENSVPRIYAALFNPMWDQNSAVYEVRTYADQLRGAAFARVQETGPPSHRLRPYHVRTSGRSLQTDRFIESCLALLAFLPLVLASIGLYGIMAYVARRTRDVGIRLALGAEPGKFYGKCWWRRSPRSWS